MCCHLLLLLSMRGGQVFSRSIHYEGNYGCQSTAAAAKATTINQLIVPRSFACCCYRTETKVWVNTNTLESILFRSRGDHVLTIIIIR